MWCVFDVEAPEPHPRLEEAIRLAGRNNISCAVSHPCFEVWPLLHLVDQRAHIASSDDAGRLLERVLPGYTTRRKFVDYGYIKAGYEKARERAIRLEAMCDGSARLRDRSHRGCRHQRATDVTGGSATIHQIGLLPSVLVLMTLRHR